MAHALNQTGDGFRWQSHGGISRVRPCCGYAALDEIDPDLDATIGRAPDAPARLKMEENPAINKREKYPPRHLNNSEC